MMEKLVLRKTSTFCAVCLAGLTFGAAEAGLGPVLNEIMPADIGVLADEDGDYPGWIELLNGGPDIVDLGGYGLSDNPREPFRWVFPSMNLEPGAALLVFTSGKNRRTPPSAQVLSTNAPLVPSQVRDLALWLDAADLASFSLADGKVAVWRDKGGRVPPHPADTPKSPDQFDGLCLWFDAADEASLVMEKGQIARWLDKSGLGNHAVQDDGAARPTITTNSINGLRVVRFDGQNDYLRFPRQENLQSVLWVVREDAEAPPEYRPLLGDEVSFDFHRGELGRIYWAMGGIRTVVGAQTWLNGEQVDPTQVSLGSDTVLVTTVASEPLRASTLSWDRGLQGRCWWGEVAEMIAFERKLSQAERESIESYLQRKWNLPRTPVRESYDAFQTAHGRRPAYGADQLTGLPCVWFDGEDDGLEFPRIDQVRSAFWVVRENHNVLANYRPILGDTVTYDFHAGQSRLLFNIYSAHSAVVYGQMRLDGQPAEPIATRLPATWAVLSLVTAGNCRANNLAWDRAATDRCFAGQVAELILYDRALTKEEVAGIETYLQQKWRLPARVLHTSFSLGDKGGNLCLTAPDATRVDELSFPAITGGYSCGRPFGSPTTLAFFSTPTPGAPNPPNGFSAICAEPLVLPAAGFYSNSVTVVVNAASPAEVCYYTLDGAEPAAPTTDWLDEAWIDDTLPTVASTFAEGGDDWLWPGRPVPVSGTKAHRSQRTDGYHMHGFQDAVFPLRTVAGDRLFVHVFLDPLSVPSEVVVQWHADGWWHRAFWGEDKLGWDATNSALNYYAGPLPKTGQWVRLEVPAAPLKLENASISGMAFCLYDGAAWWDLAGRSSTNLSRAVRYTTPFVLTNSNVLRVRSCAAGCLPSTVVTKTYLVNVPSTVPVVSIASDPQGLFGEQRGLLVAGSEASPMPPYLGANFWKKWERPVNAEFFDTGTTSGFNLTLGLQVHGNWSRSAPQKSLELHARRRYGTGKIRCAVFPGLQVDEFETLMLRNGGNDWNRAMLRDHTLQSIAEGLHLGIQAGRPAHVFLNGQYYGILNLREFADENHIAAHFTLSPSDIDMIFSECEVVAGDIVNYSDLVSYIKGNDLREPANYRTVTNWIDIDNYIDYEATQIFCDNRDWPGNNVLCWRPRSGDARWRWIVDDLDAGFDERMEGPTRNTLEAAMFAPSGGSAEQSSMILRSLLGNPDFLTRFLTRFVELLNTRFLPENVIARIDAAQALLDLEIQKHIDRWKDIGDFTWPSITNVAQWLANVEHLRAFARERPAHVRNHLDSRFDLGGSINLTVDATRKEGGVLQIDRLQIEGDQLPWSGLFFRNLPVAVRAIPQPGYRFAGWIGAESTNSTISLTLAGDTLLAAHFETDEEYDLDQLRPRPHDLRWSDYALTDFPANTPAQTYPPCMLFYQTSQRDPGLETPMESEWTLPYNRGSRSRMQGWGQMGFSFINTGEPQPEPGAGFLGAAVLAIRTTSLTNIQVSWIGGTIAPNSRVYAIRLQYRLGTVGEFRDVLDAFGQPVEYVRSEIVGDLRQMGPVTLPPDANNQLVVQLCWKYYHVPTGASGARAELRIDDIQVWPLEGRRPIVSLSCRRAGDQRMRISCLAMPGESLELLRSDDLARWVPVRVLTADGSGKVEIDVPTAAPQLARFYKLHRVSWNLSN